MSKPNRNSCTACEVLSYTFPKLHEGKSVFVEFYQIDPTTGQKKRKRYHLNHIKRRRERNAYASQLITAINQKLSTGWNVWVRQGDASQYGSFEATKELYISVINKQKEKGGLRKSSVENYTTYLNRFCEWIAEKNIPLSRVFQLTKKVCMDFLEYLVIE